MSLFLDEVSNQLNLRWAWEKVRNEATPGDIWFDQIELAGFELELERNLQNIADEFRKGKYQLSPIRPMPFPKNPDKEGNPRVRQVFQVAIRDQVAWTAVVNVVGPHVDNKMPPWSYGNRLYRSIWVEEDEQGRKRRRIGRYRHSSGHIYLPFRQSWPIFRRHVYLATRAMVIHEKLPGVDERTQEEMDFQQTMPDEYKCPFIKSDYWQSRRPEGCEKELFWCSIDLEKFYPTINLSVVQSNIVGQLPSGWQTDASELLESMLRFQMDRREWSDGEMKQMDLDPSKKSYSHVPTGLYIAGFLANAGLLKVDEQVVERLKERNVAHFRFVDDHIVLAYKFEDLIAWVREYVDILAKAGTGAKVNPEKVEPEEVAQVLSGERRRWGKKRLMKAKKQAEQACRLDPQFPSPLMTKTLALVSGIARTDFNLLEPAEMAALTDQLEHLLVVDIPEEEMPEKTRLSFAATRLTLLAESRLANDEAWARLCSRTEELSAKLSGDGLSAEIRVQLEQDLAAMQKETEEARKQRNAESNRAFELMRKVLRQRPDRVRLWTRAVIMCRLTGVGGLRDIFSDIKEIGAGGIAGRLAAAYLRANLVALLGDQVMIAARLIRDNGVADWRKQAAKSFLENVATANIEPANATDSWFLCGSWLQYCFGLYCASLVLKDSSSPCEEQQIISFPEDLLVEGQHCASQGGMEHSPVQWVWWAGCLTLRDLEPRPAGFLAQLGSGLPLSRESIAFWRFFPLDVPNSTLVSMIKKNEVHDADSVVLGGWWFDALRKRSESIEELQGADRPSNVIRVRRLLELRDDDTKTVSLYRWCDYLQTIAHGALVSNTDPRIGEWTALELVRQAACLVGEEPLFGAAYLKSLKQVTSQFPWVHPANFRVPIEWIKGEEPTWEQWQEKVRSKNSTEKLLYVKKRLRIVDTRYTPLKKESPLFQSVNPVRGLGLLLYGLLKNSFELPAMWNGSGHADVLGMLPKLLLDKMTCSSWTLGILQGCLMPRVTENLVIKMGASSLNCPDDDMLRDPFAFTNATALAVAIRKCQKVLETYQLSTLEHKARQLIPISIQQLTTPEWSSVFGDTVDEGRGNA